MNSLFIALWLFAAIILNSASAQEARTSGSEQSRTPADRRFVPPPDSCAA